MPSHGTAHEVAFSKFRAFRQFRMFAFARYAIITMILSIFSGILQSPCRGEDSTTDAQKNCHEKKLPDLDLPIIEYGFYESEAFYVEPPRKIYNQQQTCIDRALLWLASHQEADGRWDCQKYGANNGELLATALAQIAFLGAGNSAKYGPYRETVRTSEAYILSHRDERTGRIGAYGIEAAITLRAIAESSAMEDNKKLLPIIQGQVDDALRNQNPDGGWGAIPGSESSAAPSDPLISAWWVQGLKSAKVCGARIDVEKWKMAQTYFRSLFELSSNRIVRLKDQATCHPEFLYAAGLSSLGQLDVRRTDPLMKGIANYFLANPQSMPPYYFSKRNSYPLSYFLDLGFYQMGMTSPYWKVFRPELKRFLFSVQQTDGTWPVFFSDIVEKSDQNSMNSLISTTAICCQMLECYGGYGGLY